MEEIRMTELEAIKFTVANGFNGEEMESYKFKKLGCLDGQRDKETNEFKNSGMIKFIRKLETLYNSVKVEGKGKKRIYVLNGKKEYASEIVDHRKSNGLTEDDVIMRQFIYNRLKELELSNPRSHYQFAVECGLVNINDLSKVEMKASLKEIYDTLDDSKIILNDFIQTLKQRNTDVIKMAFKWLAANKYVHTKQVYMAVINKKAGVISKEFYDQLRFEFLEIISWSTKMSESQFRFKKANPQFIKNEEKHIFENVEKLYQSYNIDSVFVAVSVTLLNRDLFDDISITDFRKAYINKLIYLAERKQKRNDNKKATYLSKKFVSFNTYLLMQHLPFEVEIDQTYLNYTKTIKKAVFLKQLKETSDLNELLGICDKNDNTKPVKVVSDEDGKPACTLDDILSDVDIPSFVETYYRPVIHNGNESVHNEGLAKAIAMLNFN